uniref:Uncharacterized protein n=1 Tax=Oryza punctata TaxID=4537 RepID=A0A0E0MAG5_ORYPU
MAWRGRDFSKVRVQKTEEKQGLGISYWDDALQQKLHFSTQPKGDESIEVVADNNGWSFMGEDVVVQSGIVRKSRIKPWDNQYSQSRCSLILHDRFINMINIPGLLPVCACSVQYSSVATCRPVAMKRKQC